MQKKTAGKTTEKIEKTTEKITEKILYIDAKDYHLDEENAFAIHPQKLPFVLHLEKESFDKAVIKNSPTSDLKAHGFFNICRALKENGVCEVYIDQPIQVMQNIEASEIESIAKFGGFSKIEKTANETVIKQNNKDVKTESIKLTMIKLKKEDK